WLRDFLVFSTTCFVLLYPLDCFFFYISFCRYVLVLTYFFGLGSRRLWAFNPPTEVVFFFFFLTVSFSPLFAYAHFSVFFFFFLLLVLRLLSSFLFFLVCASRVFGCFLLFSCFFFFFFSQGFSFLLCLFFRTSRFSFFFFWISFVIL